MVDTLSETLEQKQEREVIMMAFNWPEKYSMVNWLDPEDFEFPEHYLLWEFIKKEYKTNKQLLLSECINRLKEVKNPLGENSWYIDVLFSDTFISRGGGNNIKRKRN